MFIYIAFSKDVCWRTSQISLLKNKLSCILAEFNESMREINLQDKMIVKAQIWSFSHIFKIFKRRNCDLCLAFIWILWLAFLEIVIESLFAGCNYFLGDENIDAKNLKIYDLLFLVSLSYRESGARETSSLIWSFVIRICVVQTPAGHQRTVRFAEVSEDLIQTLYYCPIRRSRVCWF